MAGDPEKTIARLLAMHGTLFSADLGIDLTQNTPSPLFRWLCAALLLSARISHKAAMNAARELADAGLTTAEHVANSTWQDRVTILNRAGYGRYDESTARMLGDTARLLLRAYDGDLRKLRDATDHDPNAARAALKDCKGIGDVGADIFLREVQTVWPEHYPFADEKARRAAHRLGLPDTADALAQLVDQSRFALLVTALVRAELSGTTRDDLTKGDET
ncbi:hypothetical protein [Yoonia sp.]|uniref:hypothetical protein n=1 Tax=Yoonia sp. TaxID=2212373 RepID=UPI003F6C832F